MATGDVKTRAGITLTTVVGCIILGIIALIPPFRDHAPEGVLGFLGVRMWMLGVVIIVGASVFGWMTVRILRRSR